MNAVKKAMLEQLNDADPENVENALFVLSQENDLSHEELLGVSEILKHPNEDTRYAALMVLVGTENLEKQFKDQILPFLDAPEEEIQTRVAKYIYDNYLSPWFAETPEPLDPKIGHLVVDKIQRTTNEETLFYLLATIPDFELENIEIVNVVSPWVDPKYKEETLRMCFACLARRKGLKQETIQKIFRLFETHESAGVKMGAANVLSQCDEAPEEIQKKAIAFFNDPDSTGMQDYMDSVELEESDD